MSTNDPAITRDNQPPAPYGVMDITADELTRLRANLAEISRHAGIEVFEANEEVLKLNTELAAAKAAHLESEKQLRCWQDKYASVTTERDALLAER